MQTKIYCLILILLGVIIVLDSFFVKQNNIVDPINKFHYNYLLPFVSFLGIIGGILGLIFL